MARIPSVKAFTGTSVEVLNAIRNSASTSYRDFVPFAQPDSESVKKIGAIIMQYPALQNEFLNNLINRIGLVIVTNKLYSNPWRMFKKGILEMGESVEEIFVNIAKVSQFDPSVAEETVFQRQIPDVRATFHIMNYQKFYKDTISDDQLRQAFVSWDGVTDLIARIVNSMYTAAEYDEFLMMRYMLAQMILDRNVYIIPVARAAGATDAEYNRALSTQIKAISNSFTFLGSRYNAAGVMTHTEKSKQYLITTVDFDANLDVESLAFAFNMDKIQFAGNRILVPSFGFDEGEVARINEILNTQYSSVNMPITEGLNTELKSIKCALVSGDFFRVYDNLIKFTEIYNSEGLYWNYSLHTWKTFSVSPFENAVVFGDGTAPLVTITGATYSAEFVEYGTTEGATAPAIIATNITGNNVSEYSDLMVKAAYPYNIIATYTDSNGNEVHKAVGTPVNYGGSNTRTVWYCTDLVGLDRSSAITLDFDTPVGHQTIEVSET